MNKNPSWEHMYVYISQFNVKHAAGDMYATFDIVRQLCAFSSCSYLPLPLTFFLFLLAQRLTAVY